MSFSDVDSIVKIIPLIYLLHGFKTYYGDYLTIPFLVSVSGLLIFFVYRVLLKRLMLYLSCINGVTVTASKASVCAHNATCCSLT